MDGHQDVTGDNHPSRRAYRAKMRPPPERMQLRVAEWRRRIRPILLGIGNPASLELWRGASLFTGEPIVVIAARMKDAQDSSLNNKTGDMVQIYILPQSDPRASIETGADRAVCGTCTHRPRSDDPEAHADCYVNLSWAPRNLWRWWVDGRTPLAPPRILEGAAVRFGAWGDPAAVPLEVWEPIVRGSITHTGYTQRWPELEVAEWGWLMASVTTKAQLRDAQIAGWRTFRTLYGSDTAMEGEHECLATSKGVTCLGCGGCGGDHQPARASYTVAAHGMRKSRAPIAEAK